MSTHRLAKRLPALAVAAASVAFLTPGTRGAVVLATSSQSAASGPFTPTYTVPANDVLLNLTPTASAGSFTVESSGGLPALTNGTFGSISGGNVSQGTANNSELATAGGGTSSGTTVTYTLTGSVAGYTISSIQVLGGWNDGGRDQQLYNVYYSTVASPSTFIQIGSTVNFNPSPAPAGPSADQTIISDNTSAPLATGVAALRFDFAAPNGPSGVENGYTGYTELIAVGTPEPASAGLLGLSALGLLSRRRRFRRA